MHINFVVINTPKSPETIHTHYEPHPVIPRQGEFLGIHEQHYKVIRVHHDYQTSLGHPTVQVYLEPYDFAFAMTELLRREL